MGLCIEQNNNMVLTLVICLATMASAEPGYLYGGYGTHSLGASVGIAGYAPAAVPGAYEDMLELEDILLTLVELFILLSVKQNLDISLVDMEHIVLVPL